MARTRPPALRDGDLAQAVIALRDDMEIRYGLIVDIEWPESPYPLPLVTAVTLYRFFQESLLNVVKHADVDDALLTLAVDEQNVVAIVQDKGPGSTPTRSSPSAVATSAWAVARAGAPGRRLARGDVVAGTRAPPSRCGWVAARSRVHRPRAKSGLRRTAQSPAELAPAARQRGNSRRQWRQTRRRGEHVAPRLEVRAEVIGLRSPGHPQLDVRDHRAGGHRAVAV